MECGEVQKRGQKPKKAPQKTKTPRFVADVKYLHSFRQVAGFQRASRASPERAQGHTLSSQLTSVHAKRTRFVLKPWTRVALTDTLDYLTPPSGK